MQQVLDDDESEEVEVSQMESEMENIINQAKEETNKIKQSKSRPSASAATGTSKHDQRVASRQERRKENREVKKSQKALNKEQTPFFRTIQTSVQNLIRRTPDFITFLIKFLS